MNPKQLKAYALAALLAFSLWQLPLPAGAQAKPESAPLDDKTRAAVIEDALQALNSNYVFPDKAKEMEQAIRARAARKEYDNLADAEAFARALTQHLQEVSHDKHLRVLNANGGGANFATRLDPALNRLLSAKRNYGFEKIERLGGNVGYLDLRGFEDPGAARDTVTAAMTFLANTDALIFDLRQNGGGSPHMVALLSSYLFDKPVHLNSIYDRPSNSTQEFWTQAEVPGKRYGDKPVFILTSKRTFSAAEEFTYNLKNLKRAVIIGETTGGGAHPVSPQRLGTQFILTVPMARSINPITKTNWEGTGVTPDIAVSAEQALKVAHLAALKALQPKTTEPLLAAQLQTLIEATSGELAATARQAVEGLAKAAPAPTAAAPTPPTPSAPVTVPQTDAKLPDTPAGHSFGKFLNTINSGSLDEMKRFHRESGGDEGNAQQDFGLYQQTGGLQLHSLASSTEFELTALVQTKKDQRWLNFSIGVEHQAPHAIADIRVQPTTAPGSATPANAVPTGGARKQPGEAPASPKKLSEAEALKETERHLQQLSAADEFSGVVLIAKNGQPLWQRAYGFANKAFNTPNRLDTKFNLGSINKFITHTAILQLVEAGKLNLDDTLGKYLPDYPNQQAAAKVTISHLLNMQSGIGDFFGAKFEATPKDRIRTINDYLKLFAEAPLAFEPGTSQRYSNGGYVVLGAIIEKVTGQSYYDYVRERIYKPAGMTNTDAYEVDASVPNVATGYTRHSGRDGNARVDNVYTKPARGSSAGGGYSTAEDLLKFAQALEHGKLLDATHSRQMFGRLGIAGGAPGINAILEGGPPGGYSVIVLSNYDPPSAEDVAAKIRGWLGMRD
ncbi:MAG: serine hydrolase [Acidobacteria bacterium]|nr:serine hydrolase [Acidobacteriota bacterium]MBI3423929.1 serine hydrolase [Acidobacteriota bacterium]